jgi:hypothetical protein
LENKRHWAFQPPIHPKLPAVRDPEWIRTPIDAFILAKLEEKGLAHSGPADKLTLLRRVTFDLTGLPPTVAEIAAFEKDDRPDAYERVVDRLLASSHYGERWAQHWLDVVRYAESNGYEGDSERPSAWRYRDYVVKSFNDDKPFDRFILEQLAGDEFAAGKDVRAHADLWIATGMNRCGPVHVVSGNLDAEIVRQEVLTEMVMGIGSAFLGLTLNCARCHDHKFDPISQADYYGLEAFFASAKPKEVDYSTPEERSAVQMRILAIMAKVAPIKTRVGQLDVPYQEKLREGKKARLEEAYRKALAADPKKRTLEQEKLVRDAETLLKVTWDEILAAMTPEDRERRAALRAEQHALEAELPMPPAQAWAIVDDGKPTSTYILKRGDVKNKGPVVTADFPRVLRLGAQASQKSSRSRRDLAAWLTSPDQPLTARVLVNRLWQHHFGRGIVGTPNDFGARGAPPTHPELLDWLATEFMNGGWRIKPMHRLMVLSSTYRQSSQGTTNKIDPDNGLLWRMNRQRLDGETIRDAMLASAGTLNHEIGGPMVRVPLEPEVYDLIFTEGEPDGLWPLTVDERQHARRSIYLFAKRNVRLPLLEVFDQPDRLTPCADRAVSTFAPQALILMNGPFARAQSRALAGALVREHGDNCDKWIDAAYRRCLGRPAHTAENKAAKEFLRQQTETVRDRLRSRLKVAVPKNLPGDVDMADAVALADLCLALFNTNEFVYVP